MAAPQEGEEDVEDLRKGLRGVSALRLQLLMQMRPPKGSPAGPGMLRRAGLGSVWLARRPAAGSSNFHGSGRILLAFQVPK